MKMRVLVLSILAFCISHCGSKTDRSAATIPTPSSGTSLSSDTESSMGLVASNMNEAATSSSQGDLSTDTTTTLHLAGGVLQARACVVDTDTLSANVTIVYSGNESRTKGGVTTSLTETGTETRVWTNTVSQAQVPCGPLKKYVGVDWASVTSVNGLQLVNTTNISLTASTKFSGGSRTLVDGTSGTRNISWATPTGATNTTTVTKTAVVDVTHTVNLTKLNGTLIDLSGTHATLTSAPLVVTKTSDTSGNALSYNIVSGTMSITKANKFYVTNAYSNVLFTLSSSDPCTPTSGTITTNIFTSSSDTTPLKTYTITFGTGGASVTNDTTATASLNSNIYHDCPLIAGS